MNEREEASVLVPIAPISRRTLWLVVALFFLFTAYHTFIGYHQANLGNSDQVNIGIMELKLTDATLYRRDYAFHNTDLFQFYTPHFISLVSILKKITGSFELGLVVLMPPIMMVYLSGMFFLVHWFTRSASISFLMAVVSSFPAWTIAVTFWGVTGLETIMPRTLFLMFAPGLFLLLIIWLEDKGSWWRLPLLLLGTGLLANVHPVSGLVVVQLMLSLILLVRGLSRRTVAILALSGLAALLGALPILLNMVVSTRAVSSEPMTISFAAFYEVMHLRFGTLFPIQPTFLNFFGYELQAAQQIMIVWLYVVCMGLWLAFCWLRRRWRWVLPSGRALFLVLFLVQLPLAFLLTMFQAHALILLVAVYALVLPPGRPDKWDWRLLALMALVIVYSFVAGYFLDLIWKQFELWSLTTWLGEQMRIARFIFLPLYLFLARFLKVMEDALEPGWATQSFIGGLALLLLLPEYYVALIVAGACLVILLRRRLPRLLERRPWLEIVLESMMVILALNVPFTIFSIEKWPIIYVAALFALFRFAGRSDLRSAPGRRRAGTMAGVTLLALGGLGSYQGVSADHLRLLPAQIWHNTMVVEAPPQRRAQLALYEWARAETGVDALFYTESLEFRFGAQRSITHAWKDLGIAYYSRRQLVPFFERFKKLHNGYRDESLLLQYAREYEVDFVIVEKWQQLYLELPVAFENEVYTVYAVR
jgi:hypothetical protein